MVQREINKTSYVWQGFFFLIFGSVLFLLLNICIGSVFISVDEILGLFTGDIGETNRVILMEIRIPRTLAAFVLGGGLALSGYLLQTFFRNPIAGPFVLGISSGAKMVVAFVLVFALDMQVNITSALMILAAFFGAMLSMGFVLLLKKVVDKMSMLVVAGVMIGYICSAITDFVVTFAEDSNIVNLHNWSMGSFSGITWDNVRVIVLVVSVCFFCVFLLAKPILAYQLGDAYAENLGVNLSLLRSLLVILSSVLAACVTAFAGPISFVGIAVPHLIRGLFHTAKPIIMIPACFLGGGIFCLVCDLLSRVLFAPTELSISSVTAVLGAPIVIGTLIKYRGRQ